MQILQRNVVGRVWSHHHIMAYNELLSLTVCKQNLQPRTLAIGGPSELQFYNENYFSSKMICTQKKVFFPVFFRCLVNHWKICFRTCSYPFLVPRIRLVVKGMALSSTMNMVSHDFLGFGSPPVCYKLVSFIVWLGFTQSIHFHLWLHFCHMH